MRNVWTTVLVSTLLAGAATAEEVVFEFTGEVLALTGPLPAPFENIEVGDGYTFTITFDSEAIDENVEPNAGLFPAVSLYDLRVNEAQKSGSPVPLNYIATAVDIQRWGALLADILSGLTMVAIVDFEPGTFETDALPTDLAFDKMIATNFQFGGNDGFADCSITGYRRIGGLDCDAIKKFKVKCKNGKLTGKVKSDLPEGTALTLDNDGDQRIVAVNSGGKAKSKWKNQSGEHTVAVVECPQHSGMADCG